MSERICPHCGSDETEESVSGPPPIVRCSQCRLLFLASFPEPEELASYYQQDYYEEGSGERFLKPFELVMRCFREGRARSILRWLPRPRLETPDAVLDVGCGRGLLLEAFRRRGWRAVGTQLSETAAAAIRDRSDVEVLVGGLPGLDLEAESFRAITLYHVLEHLDRPGAYLREAHRLLRPDGLLVVEVPDAGGPGFRILGTRNFCLDYPHHLFFFESGALRALLEESGFEVVGTNHFSLEYTPYTALQNLLNLLPGEPNRLYRSFMRNEEGRRLRRSPWTWLHLPLGLALAVPVTVVTFLSLVFPFGNTVRFTCRRRQPIPREVSVLETETT